MDPTITPSRQPVQPEIPPNSRLSFLKSAKVWPIIVLLILLIPATGYILSKAQYNKEAATTYSPTPKPTPNVSILSDKEKSQIDAWIQKNNLNIYGDTVDIAYAGGTPLFNEATGQRTDRYDYISDKHSDRPWCTPRPACLDATPRCLIVETTEMCPKREIKISCTTDSQCPSGYTCQQSELIIGQGTICPSGNATCEADLKKATPQPIIGNGRCKPAKIKCKTDSDCTNGDECLISPCPMFLCKQGQPCPTCSGLGTCLKSTRNIKIDSALIQLINSSSRSTFAKTYNLKMQGDQVLIDIKVSDINYKIDQKFGTEKSRYADLIEAYITIDKIIDLSNDQKIIYIQIPLMGVPLSQ
ncbi:MAG TPA: hypothetical protein VKC89_00475 [Patescibacteria group bacterium]|nr:hypothetical protein [Patescibacteria group bacterium]